MSEKITIERLEARDFYAMLLSDAESAGAKEPRLRGILLNVAQDFRDLCGGVLATEDWD